MHGAMLATICVSVSQHHAIHVQVYWERLHEHLWKDNGRNFRHQGRSRASRPRRGTRVDNSFDSLDIDAGGWWCRGADPDRGRCGHPRQGRRGAKREARMAHLDRRPDEGAQPGFEPCRAQGTRQGTSL